MGLKKILKSVKKIAPLAVAAGGGYWLGSGGGITAKISSVKQALYKNKIIAGIKQSRQQARAEARVAQSAVQQFRKSTSSGEIGTLPTVPEFNPSAPVANKGLIAKLLEMLGLG